MRTCILLLVLSACGAPECAGLVTQGGACVLGTQEAVDMIEAVERLVAPPQLDELAATNGLTYAFVDELAEGRGRTYWETHNDGSEAQLRVDVLRSNCAADTALVHEALHVMEIATRGYSFNHGFADYFVRADRTLAENQGTLEYQLALEACAALCPGACQWEGIFGSLE